MAKHKLGTELVRISNNPDVLKICEIHKETGYAVYMKLLEKLYSSPEGVIPNGVRTYSLIAVELYMQSTKLIENIITFLISKRHLVERDSMIYIPHIKDEVLKAKEISEKRSAAALEGSSKSGRPKNKPARYSDAFIQSFKAYIEKINEVFDRKFHVDKVAVASFQAKAKREYKKRIDEGYKLEDFIAVMQAIKVDEYHVKTKYRYVTPEFISREDKFTRFLNIKQEQSDVVKLGNAL